MPDLVITITADQVARIIDAFGPGTVQSDVEDWLKAQLKGRVQQEESSVAANTIFDLVGAEVW